MRLVIATRNPHKTNEFRELLGDDFEVDDLSAYPDSPDVAETGKTFAENATLKAEAASRFVGELIVVADDSGLEVDALGGAPGIFSARYAGGDATDRQNIDKLQDELANCCQEQRVARFRCVLALAQKGRLLGTFAGVVEGQIIDQPRGNGGFGYDPIFVPTGFDQTFAELPAATKNAISHRAKAVRVLREGLTRLPPSK